MMVRRLPPLNALRAFEAAGRHVSFTKAAEELLVTPGAVSRQIKQLEEFLGIELFERTSRDLRITSEARDYVASLGGAFDQIESATKRTMGAQRGGALRLQCAMTFTLRWLVPRLPLFHRLYPKRDIQLATSLSPMPASQIAIGDVDIAIQQGTGEWSGLVSHRLAGSALIPVCSPSFARNLGSPAMIAALGEATLLHSMVRPLDWRCWLDAAGAREVSSERGLEFESSTLAYQSAIEGMGVAIGQMVLVVDDLSAGRLMAPFDFIHDNGYAYYLTYAEQALEKPGVAEFRDWILGQAAEYEATLRNLRLPGVKSPVPA